MIHLSPTGSLPATCPRCQATHTASLAMDQVRFFGAVTMVSSQCPACGIYFQQTLPNGQFNRFPVSMSTDGQWVNVPERGRWLAELVRRVAQHDHNDAMAQRGGIVTKITAPHSAPIDGAAVTLLLCLDPCFGHALLMLFDAQRHHVQPKTGPDRPIIAVVPRALAWLVPHYVAETWVVEATLSALNGNVPNLDLFVKQQLARFSDVFISPARIHFDHRTTRFSDFTRTPKFDLHQFDRDMPRLTFVLREDRLWLRHGWERLLHKAVVKLGLERRTRPLWARWQAVRFRKLKSILFQKGMLANAVAVGITGGGQYPIDLGYAIHDDRQRAPLTPEQERTWCERYAQSHLVIGVHGSGMLLPTSLAAGFICLLPPDKLAHYAEDVLMAHDNPIHQTLLGRFLPTAASPKRVADMVLNILTEFPVWLAEERERVGDKLFSTGLTGLERTPRGI